MKSSLPPVTLSSLAPPPPPPREWVEIIRRVRAMPEQKVKSLLAHEVDPRRALMTIDLEFIDSVTATDQEKRYRLLALYCSNAPMGGADYSVRSKSGGAPYMGSTCTRIAFTHYSAPCMQHLHCTLD